MYADGPRLNALSKLIIGRSFVVANALGTGFLEKVYENALALELRDQGHGVEQQRAIDVRYRDTIVGHYAADLFVEDAILIEVKATKSIDPAQLAQCRHYLKAMCLHLCLLINFGGPRVEVKRIVLDL